MFLANLAVSGWIKFIKYPAGAWVMTGIVGLGLVYLGATILQWLIHLVKASKPKHQVTPPPFPIGYLPLLISDYIMPSFPLAPCRVVIVRVLGLQLSSHLVSARSPPHPTPPRRKHTNDLPIHLHTKCL